MGEKVEITSKSYLSLLIEEIFLPNSVDFVSMQESFDTSSPFGKAMIGLPAVFAQLEREQIKERTRMGRIARAKAGLFHGGGKLPTGYDYKDGKLVVNPYEAEQIRKIFNWYLEGMSLNKIAENLREEEYSTRYGKYKNWASVRNILRCDVYTGRIKFGDVIVENAHEAIISKKQFEDAQAMHVLRNGQYGKRGFQSKNKLTGMLICGNCGARYHKFTVKKYSYYSCYSRHRASPLMIKNINCKNKIWRAADLEAIIEERVRQLLTSPQIAKELAASNHSPSDEVAQDNSKIEKRISEIDKQIGKLMDLYQVDGIPPEILGEKINALYHEKSTLESALVPSEEPEIASFDLIEALISNAAQIWDFADDAQKRRIIQGLIKRIVLTGDDVKIEWAF